MKTDLHPVSFLSKKSGITNVSKIGNSVVKYFAVGILALLAVGVFTSSQEVNAG